MHEAANGHSSLRDDNGKGENVNNDDDYYDESNEGKTFASENVEHVDGSRALAEEECDEADDYFENDEEIDPNDFNDMDTQESTLQVQPKHKSVLQKIRRIRGLGKNGKTSTRAIRRGPRADIGERQRRHVSQGEHYLGA